MFFLEHLLELLVCHFTMHNHSHWKLHLLSTKSSEYQRYHFFRWLDCNHGVLRQDIPIGNYFDLNLNCYLHFKLDCEHFQTMSMTPQVLNKILDFLPLV